MLRALGFLFAVLLLPKPVIGAQLPIDIPLDVDGVTYSDDIPAPQRVIGHRIGERHTLPHQVVDYYRAIAAVSDRVVVREHGKTYENRPLIHAIVTSPANHSRLEEIRRANVRLSDAPGEVSDQAVSAMPAVVNLSFSIHGNEASGTDAAMLLIYHLAAGRGHPVEDALENLVMIIDPSLNPDGRSRFANWANRFRGKNATADSQDMEHNEPWPGGRTNHYWFDMNRDWMPVQLWESQGRIELFHHWRPQLLTDFHEMGSDRTFFFQPGVPIRNNPNTPQRVFDLTQEIATYHARALDRIGSLYYSKETFDDFYYGKGSTYPDINGAVGILFEQASSRALRRDTPAGVMSYAFTIRNHFTAALSTLQSAVALREQLLRHQRDFYAGAPDFVRDSDVKGYVLDLSRTPHRTLELAEVLRRHRIRLFELARDAEFAGESFQQGQALVVPLDQPQAQLIRAIMESVTSFADSIFYDVSAWTLPLAFGVSYAELTNSPDDLLGPEVGQPLQRLKGSLVGGRAPYAYVMEWGPYYAGRALYRLQSAGIHPRMLQAPVTLEAAGTRASLGRGAIIVPVAQREADPELVHNTIAQAVEQDGVTVYALTTGLTPEGPALGSPSSSTLEKPRVALLAGNGISAYEAGEVWFALDRRMDMPVSLLDAGNFNRLDLGEYNTLILVSGSYASLEERDVEKLREWIRSGGCLIAVRSAAFWAVRQGLVEEKIKETEPLELDVPYEEVSQRRGAEVIGGTMFSARVDTTHPIAYGQPSEMTLFRTQEDFLEPSKVPGANVAVYTSDPLLSGYVSERRLEQLRNTAGVIARRSGRGSVVLFADNPNFRAFWYGSQGLFLNAVFFGRNF